jgi:hypothetical protein
MLALVWIAGPLSGVLVQPYVGLKSDNCRLHWGKRRPFIVGGAAATILSLMVLAWAKELMGGFLGLFGGDPDSDGVKTCIMLFAVLFVYVLDFAINVSKCSRKLVPALSFPLLIPKQFRPVSELTLSMLHLLTNKNPPTPG